MKEKECKNDRVRKRERERLGTRERQSERT